MREIGWQISFLVTTALSDFGVQDMLEVVPLFFYGLEELV